MPGDAEIVDRKGQCSEGGSFKHLIHSVSCSPRQRRLWAIRFTVKEVCKSSGKPMTRKSS